MTTTTVGLLGAVEPYVLGALPRPVKVELYGRILLYVFGGCKQNAVKRFMITIPFDYPAWKKNLRHNGTLYKNSKLYAYAHCVNPIGPKDAGISAREASAIRLALEYPPLRDRLKTFEKQRCSPLSLAKIDAYFSTVLTSQDIRSYTAKYVYRKLRFLESYGTTLKDLQSTVINAAYAVLLKQYPNFENYAHLHKLAKVAVHNCGINLIKTYTSQGRNRLGQHSDGTYYSNTSSLTDDGQSGVSIGEEGYTLTSYLVTGLDGAVFSQWERIFSLRQLLSSPKLTGGQRRYLKLMLCEPDEEFTNFMEGPPSVLYEKDFEEYQRQVCIFLNITAERGKRFLNSLQQFL